MNLAADYQKLIKNPVILLHALDGVGLLSLRETGVVYVNQVGGHQCMQCDAEGAFVPLETWTTGMAESLQRHFVEKFGGWGGFDSDTADLVDRLLSASLLGTAVRVDRSMVAESTEAWVHVVVEEKSDGGLFSGFGGQGILTWPNSD